MGSNNLPKQDRPTSKEQEIEVEILFSSIGDAIITTDKYGKITRANAHAHSILGLDKNELVGKWYPKTVIATDQDGTPINLIDRPITRAYLTGQSVPAKTYLKRKNGSIVPVALTVSPVLVQGTPSGAIQVFRDITKEEEIDRMKSEFISLASHQLRTPLTAIKTYSHMLADGYMGEITQEQKASLHTIISATNRMNELISTLLNITRIETGTIVISKRPFRINKMIDEVCREVTLLAEQRGILLTIDSMLSDSEIVKTDQIILKEIVANLITNAIKYTPPRGTVQISTRKKAQCLHITVTDSGWGIPEYEHEQIFSKFFRGKDVIKRETTGTGLGLYLVKGLTDALGGDISFTSDVGVGTSFTITLPLNSERDEKPK